MTTSSILANSILQVINENIIDDLLGLGYDHPTAVKVVTEYSGDIFAEDDNSPF
jgi:hypothetical protein